MTTLSQNKNPRNVRQRKNKALYDRAKKKADEHWSLCEYDQDIPFFKEQLKNKLADKSEQYQIPFVERQRIISNFISSVENQPLKLLIIIERLIVGWAGTNFDLNYAIWTVSPMRERLAYKLEAIMFQWLGDMPDDEFNAWMSIPLFNRF